jgi:hypothetical protein
MDIKFIVGSFAFVVGGILANKSREAERWNVSRPRNACSARRGGVWGVGCVVCGVEYTVVV